MAVDVLVISGPAGVGKSSVAFELSLQLATADIAHALIDTDEIDRIYPVPLDLDALKNATLRPSGAASRSAALDG